MCFLLSAHSLQTLLNAPAATAMSGQSSVSIGTAGEVLHRWRHTYVVMQQPNLAVRSWTPLAALMLCRRWHLLPVQKPSGTAQDKWRWGDRSFIFADDGDDHSADDESLALDLSDVCSTLDSKLELTIDRIKMWSYDLKISQP